MRRKTLLSAVLVLTLVTAACDSVSDSADDLCNALGGLQDTMEQITSADVSAGSTTVENLQNAVNEVKSGVEDVLNAASDLSDSLKSQLQDDFDQLQESIQRLSRDNTLDEARQEVVSAVTTFKQSWDQTLSELNCSTGS